MKKSRSITLALVGSAWLATGCGESNQHPHQFFDHEGKPVPRAQWKKADGTPAELFDENGDPVSPDAINQAYSATASHSSTSTSSYSGPRHYGYSSGWFWGPWYHSSSRSSIGGSSSSGSGSRAGGTTSGTVSRGGFGSTGHAMGGGSSSS